MRTVMIKVARVFVVAMALAARGHAAEPLTIGATFTIDSKVLKEQRRINVYAPPGYEQSTQRVPVLYMLDGGLGEDFLHIAGLVQISVTNQTMRPHLLVGIENTVRRRDLVGPTQNEEDKKLAPLAGGSMVFREFIRKELMPEVRARYRVTDDSAVVGESLAGLFAIETFLLEPDLFDTYIAIDPSVWWDDARLVDSVGHRLRARSVRTKTLFFASSEERENAVILERFAKTLEADAPSTLRWHYEPMPGEKHATIFHPAALKAFRKVLAPTGQ